MCFSGSERAKGGEVEELVFSRRGSKHQDFFLLLPSPVTKNVRSEARGVNGEKEIKKKKTSSVKVLKEVSNGSYEG